MKTTISFTDFRDAFRTMDRLDNFSYDGARVLFDYLEEYEEASDQEIELDVIALCCDYSEDSPEDIASYYNIEPEDDEELEDAVINYLNENTSVCGQTDAGTIVYCSAF